MPLITICPPVSAAIASVGIVKAKICVNFFFWGSSQMEKSKEKLRRERGFWSLKTSEPGPIIEGADYEDLGAE